MDFDLQTFYDQLQETCQVISRQKISPWYACVILKSNNDVIFHVYLNIIKGAKVDHINISI